VEKVNNCITGRGGSWCGLHHVYGILLFFVIHDVVIVSYSGSRSLGQLESGRRCRALWVGQWPNCGLQ